MQGIPILVIDDDASTLKLISGTLQPLGHSIINASNGDEGLVIAKSQSPSIILINLAVPGTDGLKICKAFMSIIDAPIILLTMREGKYDPRYKSQYGIVDFLKKPINPQELVAKVDELAPHNASVAAVEDVADEDVDAIEIAEDDVPSATELAASVASYAEGDEPLTPVEDVAEIDDSIEAIPEEDVAEEVEVIEEVSDEDVLEAAEIEATDEALDDGEEEIGEWSIPKEEAPAFEASSSIEELPTVEETPAFEDAPPAEETPAAGELDWGDHGDESSEEDSSTYSDVSEDIEPLGEESFDKGSSEDYLGEEDHSAFGDEGPYELPSVDEKEYEIRPAALERAKRRKSKSKILVPFIALLLIGVVATAFFVFLPGKDIIASVKDIFVSAEDNNVKPTPEQPTPKRPAPAVAKKTEPTPIPKQTTPAKNPAPPTPAPAAKNPAPPTPAPAAKKPAPLKPAPAAKKPAPPTPAPAAKGPSPTKPSASKTYYVQFGAFRSKDNAIKFQRELKDLGYDTFIKEMTSENKSLNLVLLSDKFSDKWTAFKQARQIKETSDIGTAVHME